MKRKFTTKTQEWAKARKKLKVIYEDKEITNCELRFKGCWVNNALSFAHRHKRKWYLDHPELLGEFKQTVLACIPCHDIIEDDKEMCRVYKNMFREEEKYQIEMFEDAREAFKRFEEKRFDLVLLDILMEPMSGEEFYACIRKNFEQKNTPVLVVSVLHPAELKHMEKINNIEFLRKPIKKEQLLQKMDEFLS